ncbi:BZ3500_MvSof-1268-A1-R1_Chr1-2g01410 [Microbotryum saponariae]|uniref:BZ3500_MvSof-1268-A1-R1_Chr1-2g01410 protein n=1 Tax=Microbotryum saponariae TaxID=289078 RepID=A0A2X0MX65_9BASI|nr:BZ3500_MvSof-1268-A1-R1_Chr1-2g01410 [Microbotryum saponariae]SCZ97354.1 BZ3501_MvSof-1269-A2-R1_Chr1-2g01009 [Microbotryum saponariae]
MANQIEQQDTNALLSLSSSPWHQSYLCCGGCGRRVSDRISAEPSAPVCRASINGLCLARLEQVLSKLDWSVESEIWRNYRSKLEQPHPSHTKVVEALSNLKEEASIRDWPLSTRTLSQIGTPVGISQSAPFPARIREGPAMMREGDGPGN